MADIKINYPTFFSNRELASRFEKIWTLTYYAIDETTDDTNPELKSYCDEMAEAQKMLDNLKK